MRYLIKSLVAAGTGDFGKFPTRITPDVELLEWWSRLHAVTLRQPLIGLGPNSDGGDPVAADLAGIDAGFPRGASAVRASMADATRAACRTSWSTVRSTGGAGAHAGVQVPETRPFSLTA
jgi:hypothetical protein